MVFELPVDRAADVRRHLAEILIGVPEVVRPEDVVEQLRTAGDRETARRAAWDVAHEAVADAVAVTPGSASRVAAAVRRLVEDGTPWRADAFAVLDYVLEHAHVYRDLRAGTRTYRGAWDFGIAEEEAVDEALSGFDRVVRDLLDDPDPETRSLASLTLARLSGDPAADRELLALLTDAEPDGRVRAARPRPGCASANRAWTTGSPTTYRRCVTGSPGTWQPPGGRGTARSSRSPRRCGRNRSRHGAGRPRRSNCPGRS